MSPYTFRLATPADKPAIVQFMRTHWDSPHPLIELPEFFNFYYCTAENKLNFALCEQNGALAALAGFTPASLCAQPDAWISLWAADKSAQGSGLELLNELPRLIGCRVLCCNNIRPKTMPFYNFLGHTTGRMGHFYRLADLPQYKLAKITQKEIPAITGSATLTLLPNAAALEGCGFTPPKDVLPYKDTWYITRRFFNFPHRSYNVYAAHLPSQSTPFALVCTHTVQTPLASVLRIADYIGPTNLLPQLGCALDNLLQEHGCEYADFYCAGIPAKTMLATGFCERDEQSPNILPNYLSPPLIQNTDYYYFTSHPNGFTMFKADGDQDRPNIPL